MLAAACLLVLCVFGWLFYPKDALVSLTEQQKEQTQSTHLSGAGQKHRPKINAEEAQPIPQSTLNQVAKAKKPATINQKQERPLELPAQKELVSKRQPASINEQPAVAQNRPVDKTDVPQVEIKPEAEVALVLDKSVGNTLSKQPKLERVLVVTIAEPEALLVARLAGKPSVDAKTDVVVNTNGPEEETKPTSLWQQVKRIKQGNVFAHNNKPADDDQSLLSRAYTGLKHSFDKDKSQKQ